MLYYKNGVLTEDRFKNMSLVQWLFHYFEIMKYSNEDKNLLLEKIDDINLGIQAFYLLVNKDNGAKMIQTISDIKSKHKANANKAQSTETPQSGGGYADQGQYIMSDEEKELWEFMLTQPKTMKETDHMKKVGKYMLPKASIDDLKNSQTKIVEKNDEIKKPKLGFK